MANGSAEDIRKLPDVLGLGCYLVKDDGTARKLDPSDHYKYADTGAAAKLDDSEGQYMWGWKEHYFTEWTEGDYLYWAVTLTPIVGRASQLVKRGFLSAIGHGVMDRTNAALASVINTSAQYRGGDNTQSSWDGTFRTQLGRAATSMTLDQFVAAAKKRGKNWGANYYKCNGVPLYIFAITHGTRNCQAPYNANKTAEGLWQGGHGPGVTEFNYGDEWNYFPFLPTDAGISLGDNCGVYTYNVTRQSGATVAVQIPVLFGLKNWFGYLYSWVSGMVFFNGYYRCKESINDAMDHSDGSSFPLLVSGLALDYGYIKEITMDRLTGVPTVISGASESTYYCDYGGATNSASTSVLRVVGSFFSNGSNAGAFYSRTNITASNADGICSARLRWDNFYRSKTLPLGKR
ncbi:MAG: hypothetical protein LUD76_10255 [Alistipes sp.]|nr:hypothetical protein [Alistipes sp.]